MGDRPTGERGPRNRATGAVQDDIASAGRDGGSEEDVGDGATGGRVRRVERLQDQVDRAARRSDAGRGGDHASRISAHVDRARAGVRDAGEGDLGSIRAGAGIERKRAGKAGGRGEGQRDRLGDGAGGDDVDARTGVDGGQDISRPDVGHADVREVTGQGAGRAGGGDGDVRRVDQPRAAGASLHKARKFEQITRGLDAAAERADGAGDGGDAVRVRDVGPEHDLTALPCVDRRTRFERGGDRLADTIRALPIAADEDGTAVRRKGCAGEHGDMVTGELEGAGEEIAGDFHAVGIEHDRTCGGREHGGAFDGDGVRAAQGDGSIGVATGGTGAHEAGDVDGLVDDFAGGGGGKDDATGGDLTGLFDLSLEGLAIGADERRRDAFAKRERNQAVAGEVHGERLARSEHGGTEISHEGAGITDMRGHEGAQAGVGDRERAFVDDGGGKIRGRRELELTAGEEGILIEVERGGDQARGVDGRAFAEEDPVGVDEDDATVGRDRAKNLGWSDADDFVRSDGRRGRLVEADALTLRDGEAVPLDERAVRRLVNRDAGRALAGHRGGAAGDVGAGGIGEGADGIQHRGHEERGERQEAAFDGRSGGHDCFLKFRSGRRRRR